MGGHNLAKQKHEGVVYKTNKHGDVLVLEYINSKCVIVKFLNSGYITEAHISAILIGSVKDRTVPSLFGVGVLGEASTKIDGKHTIAYTTWADMLGRVYNSKFANHSNYEDCTVSDTFKNYSYFKQWYETQKGANEKGWHLDKDLLFKGNRIYSENTCCLLPPIINVTLACGRKKGKNNLPVCVYKTNDKYIVVTSYKSVPERLGSYDTPEEAFTVYKEARERYVRGLAEEWKGKICDDAYLALIKYEVEPYYFS